MRLSPAAVLAAWHVSRSKEEAERREAEAVERRRAEKKAVDDAEYERIRALSRASACPRFNPGALEDAYTKWRRAESRREGRAAEEYDGPEELDFARDLRERGLQVREEGVGSWERRD